MAKWRVGGLFMLTALAAGVAAADTWTVDSGQPDDSQCASPTFLCKTIGAAVAGAVSGDTINVLAGSYNENVTIGEQLTITGAQAGVDACSRPGTGESVWSGAGVLLTLVTGSANTVVNGMTFSGGTRHIVSATGPINGVQLLYNRHVGFTGNGVFLNDSGIDITVNRNLIDGSSLVGNGALFHMDTDNFAGFHFTNNCVSRGVTGLFVDGNRNVTSSGNRAPLFDGNTFELLTIGMNAGSRALDDTMVSNNTFRNNTQDGMLTGPQDSTITRNRFIDNGRAGLRITTFGNVDVLRGCRTTFVTENCFSGNGFAPGVATNPAGILTQSSASIATCHFHDNNIAGNAMGMENLIAATIEAENNYWGAADGPSGPDGTGSGDGVNGNAGNNGGAIDFSPYSANPAPNAASCEPPPPVPAASTTGVVVLLAALLSVLGFWIVRRRRAVA